MAESRRVRASRDIPPGKGFPYVGYVSDNCKESDRHFLVDVMYRTGAGDVTTTIDILVGNGNPDLLDSLGLPVCFCSPTHIQVGTMGTINTVMVKNARVRRRSRRRT